ncbi:DUF803-domain-containing protein [Rhizoclosmatium globosum]|uniref:DUF803-domain-containing protein n=1 Tax=Rhizoclosmatium globosum TaxID=329046 RepID=A0A1Y2CIS0_9FUNG|nr:DUF803-domain-containing protein [Rhizoclosmatium globosum]|eukprot:ORY46941.1 DUF803-domain-containing protein [Rhizoclosmatium globosum]
MSNPTSNSTSTSNPAWQSVVGAALAILSGFFLGTSVVLRKRGLIEIAAEGHDVTSGSRAYLKNKFWWLGMLLQAVGEVANFGAYAFCPTILVTPMGTLAIVFNAILSSYLLNESLAFLGIMGCGLCMVGVILIVIHAIQASDPETVMDFVSYVIQPGFLVYSVFIVVLVLWLKYYAEPRWAKQTPFVYIAMSSCGGAYLVLSAQGVGSAIVYSARNWTTDNQFWQWPLYPLILFMLLAVIYQITYLNKALAVNPSAVIYPISFVCFNGMTIITTSILFQEFPVDTVSAGISVAAGLFVIVVGVILLSVSKNETQDIEVTDKIGVTRVLP